MSIIKKSAKRFLRMFWRAGMPFTRPFVRSFDNMINKAVSRLESKLDNGASMSLPPAIHAAFRSIVIELDRIEHRMDEIQETQHELLNRLNALR